jgi:hypothetical protein
MTATRCLAPFRNFFKETTIGWFSRNRLHWYLEILLACAAFRDFHRKLLLYFGNLVKVACKQDTHMVLFPTLFEELSELILVCSSQDFNIDISVVTSLMELSIAVSVGSDQHVVTKLDYFIVLTYCVFLFSPFSALGVSGVLDESKLEHFTGMLNKAAAVGTQIGNANLRVLAFIGSIYVKRYHGGHRVHSFYSTATLAQLLKVLEKVLYFSKNCNGAHPYESCNAVNADGDDLYRHEFDGAQTNILFHARCFQNLVNAWIEQDFLVPTLSMLDEGLDCIVRMAEMTYRSNSQLCSMFWSNWELGKRLKLVDDPFSISMELMSEWMPLCRLVSSLRVAASYRPGPYFRLLEALTCDTKSAAEVIELLQSSCSLCSVHEQKDLFLTGSEVRLCSDLDTIVRFQSCRFRITCIPDQSLVGELVGCTDETQNHYVIRWNKRVRWTDCLVDSILVAACELNCGKDVAAALIECSVAAVSLLGSLGLLDMSELECFLRQIWDNRMFAAILLAVGFDDRTAAILTAHCSKEEFIKRPLEWLNRCDILAYWDQYTVLQCLDRLLAMEQSSADPISVFVVMIANSAWISGILNDWTLRVANLLNVMLTSSVMTWQVSVVSAVASTSLIGNFAQIVKLNPVVAQSDQLVALCTESLSCLARSVVKVLEQHASDNQLWAIFLGVDRETLGSPDVISADELGAGLSLLGYPLARGSLTPLLALAGINPDRVSYTQLLTLCLEPCAATRYDAGQLLHEPNYDGLEELKCILRGLLSENSFVSGAQTYDLLVQVESLVCTFMETLGDSLFHMVIQRSSERLLAVGALLRLAYDLLPHHMLSSSSAPGAESQLRHSRDRVVRILRESPKFLESLMSVATLFGTKAINMLEKPTKAMTAAPHALFGMQQYGGALAESSVKSSGQTILRSALLPIDFSRYVVSTAAGEMTWVAYLSYLATSIINAALDIEVKSFDHASSTLITHALVTTRCRRTPFEGGDSAANRMPSYFQLLVSMINIPMLAPLREVVLLSKTTMRCVARVLYRVETNSSLGNVSKLSWLESFGLENISGLCTSLCSTLGNSSVSQKLRDNQIAAVDLLIVLVSFHPIAFCLMLCVSKETDKQQADNSSSIKFSNAKFPELHDDDLIPVLHNASPKDSTLSNTLLSVLKGAVTLLDECPLLLHRLYELLLAMLQNCGHTTIALCVSHIIQDASFWEYVTVPLMHDIRGGELQWNASDITGAGVGGIEQCIHRCHTNLAHASSLSLVTAERFGLISGFDGDLSKSSSSKRVDEFLAKAMNSHRFSSWVAHYTNVSFSADMLTHFTQQCLRFGYVPKDLNRHESYLDFSAVLLFHSHRFGEDYVFDGSFSRAAMRLHCCRSPNSKHTEQLKLREFKNAFERVNIQFSLSDTEMYLLESFSRFLETYLAPNKQKLNTGSMLAREHTLPVDSSSPLCLSPASVGSNESPSTSSSPSLRGESGFSGDRRSYEVISKLQLQLKVEHSRDRSTGGSSIELRILHEKLRLLCSMLHHQLKDVSLKAADPTQSHVQSRDSVTPRLDNGHLIRLIKVLLSVANTVLPVADFDGSLSHQIVSLAIADRHRDILQSSRRWLLSSMLLIVEALQSRQVEGDEVAVAFADVFKYALSALTQEIASPVDKLETESKHPFGTAQLCAPVIYHSLPADWKTLKPLHANIWRPLLEHRQCFQCLLVIFDRLMIRVANFASLECDYRAWIAPTALGSDGKTTCPRPVASFGERSQAFGEQTALLTVLISISDVFLHTFWQSVGTSTASEFLGILLQSLNKSALLDNLASVLVGQLDGESSLTQVSLPSPLLGYSVLTGDEGLSVLFWQRVLLLVENIIQFTNMVDDPSRKLLLFEGVCLFFKKFVKLLLLPLIQNSSDRFSIRSIQLVQSTVAFLVAVNRFVPAWRSLVNPATLVLIHNSISVLCSRLSCILPSPSQNAFFNIGGGASSSEASDGKVIAAAFKDCFIAVSSSEKHGMREQTIVR